MKKLGLYSKRMIIVLILVLTVIMSTLSYVFLLFSEAKADVEQNITNLSRGTYDILIRPENAQTDLEKELNLVEENYLGVGDGGISIEQWKKIKNHPDVEIAAPVASVGLFTAADRTFSTYRKEMSYFETEYTTHDGINTFISNDSIYIYDFGDDFKTRDGDGGTFFGSSLEALSNYVLSSLEGVAYFHYPPSYHQVVAVDPEEESKLTEFDLSPLSEKGLRSFWVYEDGRHSIPLMTLKDATVPIHFKLTIDGLAETLQKEVDDWYDKLDNEISVNVLAYEPELYFDVLEEFISKKRLYEDEVYTLTPEENHLPFSQGTIYIDDNFELNIQQEQWPTEYVELAGGAGDWHAQRIGYRLSPVIYKIKDSENLVVEQIGIDEQYGAPIYRELEEVEFYELDVDSTGTLKSLDDYIGFLENGSFSITENKADLASAPLGIYGRKAPYLASAPSKELHPFAVPGSFITTPAHGLVSIEYADKFAKGDWPIDAIRIKVGEITDYDKKASDLIESLAEEWREEGFTVDIVAGASLQDLTVDVEGIGKVVQAFTTLGAADTIVSSWNAMQIALTILYAFVAITFIGFTFLNLLSDRLKDEKILAQIGWSQKLIRRLRYKEWGLILGLPIVLIIGGYASLGYMKDEWLPFNISIIVSVVFIGLYFLGEGLKNKDPKQTKHQVRSVIIQNIKYYFGSLFAACIQLLLITVLTCFLPFFLLETIDMTTKTRLGAYVHGEIEGIFLIIILLLYILSGTTIYQTLSRLWERRRHEINLFLYLGWDRSATRRYFINEVFIWGGISIFLGFLVSIITTISIVEINTFTLLLQIFGFLIVLMITILGSIYSLQRVKIKGDE